MSLYQKKNIVLLFILFIVSISSVLLLNLIITKQNPKKTLDQTSGTQIPWHQIKDTSAARVKPAVAAIEGDEFLDAAYPDKRPTSAQSTEQEAYAASANNKLNIVFIADGYTQAQMTQFHQEVNAMTKAILAIEPYHYRASQIMFHTIDNTTDMQCGIVPTQSGTGADSGGSCDIQLMDQVLNAAQVPHDVAIGVVNATHICGLGSGGYVTLCTDTADPQANFAASVVTHELGHALGAFHDNINTSGINSVTVDNKTHTDCYAGTPPAAEWQGLVGNLDYRVGCTYSNWYSAYNSTMAGSADNYNAPEQKLMSTVIDTIAGPYTSTIVPPQIAFLNVQDQQYYPLPDNGDFVLFFDTSVIGDDIAWVQYFIDGIFVHSEYVPSLYHIGITTLPSLPANGAVYEYEWILKTTDYGKHTLQIKAFNVAGASTATNAVTIFINTPPTGGTPIPSISSNPTSALTPTTNPNATHVGLTVCLHGLGQCGDNANSNGTGNINPKDLTRPIIVTVLNAQNQTISTSQGTVTYNTSAKNFHGNVDISVPNGQYLLRETVPNYLPKQVPGIFTIAANQPLTLPKIALTTGDINNDHQIDILDYNMLISCFGSKATSASCQNKISPDLDDNGIIGGTDYNLFLRELSVQPGT